MATTFETTLTMGPRSRRFMAGTTARVQTRRAAGVDADHRIPVFGRGRGVLHRGEAEDARVVVDEDGYGGPKLRWRRRRFRRPASSATSMAVEWACPPRFVISAGRGLG